MNTASLGICKILHNLSGWEGTYFTHADGELLHGTVFESMVKDLNSVAPAYDLGFLLRRLTTDNNLNADTLKIEYSAKFERWFVGFWPLGSEKGYITPEDAAGRLAIELFQKGILKKQPY